jgi:hypothetical protein
MPKAKFSKIGALFQLCPAICKIPPQKIANYCNIFIRSSAGGFRQAANRSPI